MVRSSFNGQTEMMLNHGLQAIVHAFSFKIDRMLKGGLKPLLSSNFNGKMDRILKHELELL